MVGLAVDVDGLMAGLKVKPDEMVGLLVELDDEDGTTVGTSSPTVSLTVGRKDGGWPVGWLLGSTDS